MIMLKDNHIDYCGGIEKAIELATSYVKEKKPELKIEIEARSIDDVNRIVAIGKIDRIMLDNFSPPEIINALKIINRKYETEASGGINFNNLEEYAQTGVDFISSGAIIHQATSLDLSLKASIV
jgi:nicotinate-nucleotide pyrophosphorylase (carboxylating)